MAKTKHHFRREQPRIAKAAKAKEARTDFELSDDAELREDELVSLPRKRYLILCEGETEWVYFRGIKSNLILKRRLSAVTVDIIKPLSGNKKEPDENTLQDNSLKGLVWEAMQRKKTADHRKNSYDEIWIVIDHDGRNGYILTEKAQQRIVQQVTGVEQGILSPHKNKVFISEFAFRQFLNERLPDNEAISKIIDLTDKTTQFDLYANPSPEALFFKDGQFDYKDKNVSDFDEAWKNYLQKAYSCRAFEHWLVLHFERCKKAFTASNDEEIDEEKPLNPDDVIHYLRNIKQFIPQYCKGEGDQGKNKVDAYEGLKPNPFSRLLDDERAIIKKLESAIENACWLRQEMHPEMDENGLRYYEVNPYTNVDRLVSSLLGKPLLEGNFGKLLEVPGIVSATLDFETHNAILMVEMTNRQPTSLIVNQANIGNWFLIQCNMNGMRLAPILPENLLGNAVHLLPNVPCAFQVQFPALANEGDFYLKFCYSQDTENIALYPIST